MNICPNKDVTAWTVSYPWFNLLIERNFARYIIFQLRQNNGFVAYSLMPDSSCSTLSNTASRSFGEFVLSHIGQSSGNLLDIGGGSLAMPAYLANLNHQINLVSLDPLPTNFQGNVVRGVSEFLPFCDESFDFVVCSTVLDHLFDVEMSISEIKRVTRSGGKLLIWDHPRLSSVVDLKNRLPYQIYDNGLVLPIFEDDPDPFHSTESRSLGWSFSLERILFQNGFEMVEQSTEFNFHVWKKR